MTVHASPKPSFVQKRDASLQLANRIRIERSKVKQDLRTGEVQLGELLHNPPRCIHTMPIFDLLMTLPRYGKSRVNRWLTRAMVSPSKHVGTLTERQIGVLMVGYRK